MSPNDRAYIKVSTELLLLRNDLTVMAQMTLLYRDINNYTKERIKEMRQDRQHSPGREGFARCLYLMANAEELRKETRAIEARIEELERLCEAYIRGRDIVAEKLSRESN